MLYCIIHHQRHKGIQSGSGGGGGIDIQFADCCLNGIAAGGSPADCSSNAAFSVSNLVLSAFKTDDAKDLSFELLISSLNFISFIDDWLLRFVAVNSPKSFK